jgi:DNA helicase-2/ATP-dependent DNA helicase PcrA
MTDEEFQKRFPIALSEQQTAAMRAVDGPVLLLAVPGSGKTTVLVARLGYMLFVRGIAPEHILTMTYTVSATQDMRARFAGLFGEELAERLQFRTINGLSSSIIAYYARRYGREPFQLLDDPGRQSAILMDIYRRQNEEFASESTVKTLQTAITAIKNGMLTDEEIKKLEPEGIKIAPVYEAYCRTLKDANLMDYDDQMVYARQILLRCPDVLDYWQKRFSYLCVDEAQDTSRIQHEIVRLLAQRERNLFMVGDEDQSIYGFRAAWPEALMQFEKTYPGARVLLMEDNYRSTPQIVAAADRFIRLNQNRRDKNMRASRGAGKPVLAITVYDRREQYRRLAEMARNRSEQTAVLYRDNDSALPLIDILSREGTAYACRQVDSLFFSHWIVRDITDIISFAQDPLNTEIFLRIYYKLGAGISKLAAEAACTRCAETGKPVLDCLLEQPGISSWTKKQTASLRTHLANMLGEPADRAVYRIVEFMGYGEYIDKRGADRNKAEILEALGAPLSSPAQLPGRLRELCAIVKAGSRQTDCPFILSTIHSSKGLEYDRVILMDVADGLLPKTELSDEPEDMMAYEEERRLFYVGMTRARNELIIVRFRKPSLHAAFTLAVFPDRTQMARQKKTHRREPSEQELQSAAKDYRAGIRVCHGTFGPGTIAARRGDIVTVQFEDGSQRRFSLLAALRVAQLRLLP